MYYMNKIEEFDELLIQKLEENALKRNKDLAKELKVSPVTIRRRIKRLLQMGKLQFKAVSEPKNRVMAVLAYNVELNVIDKVTAQLVGQPEVKSLFLTTGQFNIIATVQFTSVSELDKFLQEQHTRMGGFKIHETFVCLRIMKY